MMHAVGEKSNQIVASAVKPASVRRRKFFIDFPNHFECLKLCAQRAFSKAIKSPLMSTCNYVPTMSNFTAASLVFLHFDAIPTKLVGGRVTWDTWKEVFFESQGKFGIKKY